MGHVKSERNAALRRKRGRGASIRMLAIAFRISTMRVRQILEATGGDPLRHVVGPGLATSTMTELERERQRLRDRIATDRRRLRAVEDEIDVRATDRLLGLTS